MVAQEPFGRPFVVKRGRSRIDLPRFPTNPQPTVHPPSSYPSGKLRPLPHGPPQLLPVELTHRELRERRDRHRVQRAGRAKERKERARWERDDRQPVRWCAACNCRADGCRRPGQSNVQPPHLGPSFPPRFPIGIRCQPRYTPLRPAYGWRVCPAYRPPQPTFPSPPPQALPVPPTPPPTPVYLPPAVVLTPPGAFLGQRGPEVFSSIPRPGTCTPRYTPTPVLRYGGGHRRVSPERQGPTSWINLGRMPWTVHRWVDEPAVQMGEPSQVSEDSPMSEADQVGHSVWRGECGQIHEGNQMCQDRHVSEPIYGGQSNQVWQDTIMSDVHRRHQARQNPFMSGAFRNVQMGEPSQARQDTPMSEAIPEFPDTLVSEPIYPRRGHHPRQNTFMSGAISDLQKGKPSQVGQDTLMSGTIPVTGENQTDENGHVAKRPKWAGWGREWAWGDRKGKRKREADDW